MLRQTSVIMMPGYTLIELTFIPGDVSERLNRAVTTYSSLIVMRLREMRYRR